MDTSPFPGTFEAWRSEHEDSKDFQLCFLIWPGTPGPLPVLLTELQAGADALQSKWAQGLWGDSTQAVLVMSHWVGSTGTELLPGGLKLRKDLAAFLVTRGVFQCAH